MIVPPSPSDYPVETVVPPSGGVFTKGCEAMKRQPDDPGADPFFEDESGPHLSVIVVGALATFLCLAGALWASKAWGHEWFSNQKNPVTGHLCCYGGPTGDCQTVDDNDWWREGARYFVRRNGQVYSIPVNQASPSQDHQGRAAACIMHGSMRCFFLPATG